MDTELKPLIVKGEPEAGGRRDVLLRLRETDFEQRQHDAGMLPTSRPQRAVIGSASDAPREQLGHAALHERRGRVGHSPPSGRVRNEG